MLLADDQAANMALLRALLQTDFEVVATVQDGRALVDAEAMLSPDVIVTDIAMPILDGIAAAREILRRNPLGASGLRDGLCGPGDRAPGMGHWRPRLRAKRSSAGDELVPAVWAALRGERWCLCNS